MIVSQEIRFSREFYTERRGRLKLEPAGAVPCLPGGDKGSIDFSEHPAGESRDRSLDKHESALTRTASLHMPLPFQPKSHVRDPQADLVSPDFFTWCSSLVIMLKTLNKSLSFASSKTGLFNWPVEDERGKENLAC